jgi:hypothetical protein
MSEDPAELWRAALEEHVRGLSDNEFQQLVARTRPPYSTFTDPAARQSAVMSAIAAKQPKRRPVDHNGYPLKKGTAP